MAIVKARKPHCGLSITVFPESVGEPTAIYVYPDYASGMYAYWGNVTRASTRRLMGLLSTHQPTRVCLFDTGQLNNAMWYLR